MTNPAFNRIALPTRLLAVSAFGLSTLPASAQSLVTNGTFDTTSISPWWSHAAEGASQTVEVVEGRMCSVITEGGENPWDVILGLSDVALLRNQHYHISFSASSDTEREIRVKTGLGEAPYTDYYLGKITAVPTPQTVQVTYLNLRDNPAAHLQFQFGGLAGTVCFDDIVLEPVAAPVVPPFVTQSLTGFALKNAAHVVKMGTAVDTPTFLSAPAHNAIVTGEFSMITPANSLKMGVVQATRGVFDWAETDALLDFAGQNGMEFHGHPLVWHTQAPGWLEEEEFDRDTMIQIMYDQIDALVGRYVGRIPYWDVVNEAIEQVDGVYGYRSTIWHDRIGPDFIDLAFQRAHAADPNALLLYNDYNISVMGHPKADYVFEMIGDMVARGIPVHQVGLQSHWYITEDGGTSGLPDVAMVRANMARYHEIGVGVQITEFDVRIANPLSDEKLQAQAQVFGDMLQACIDAPNCGHFTVWGLSDFDSWVPQTFDNYDHAHAYDDNLVAKPAYHSMTQVLAPHSIADAPAEGVGGTGGASAVGAAAAPAESSKKSSDSGCSLRPSSSGSSNGWQLALAALGMLVAARRRRGARAARR